MYYISNRKRGILRGIAIVLNVVLVLFIAVSLSIRQRIIKNLLVAAQNKFSDVCNQAFDTVTDKLKITYEDIVIPTKDSSNNITSLSVNSVLVNKIKTMLDSEVDDILSKNGKFSFSISIGTILGNEFTAGRGPSIQFEYDMFCSISTDLESNFISAGINQTKHQIILSISSDLSTASPFATEQKIDNLQYLLCETVIVGEVPQSYTNINLNR